MAVVKLTARNVLTLPAGGAGRADYIDEVLPGFVLRVSATGARTYSVRYGAERERFTIGDARHLALADARLKARDILGRVARGEDPAQEKAAARAAARAQTSTFEGLAERLVEQADLGPRTRYNWRSLLKTHVLPKIGRVEPNKITRGDLRELLEAIRAKSPITANDALKIVRWIFARAIEADLVTASPAVGLRKPTKETPRDRVATDAELRALWTEGLKHGSYGAAIRLAMLTAARREEIFSMQWGEIDDEARVWRIPAARTKNARPHDVPITDAMAEILATLKPSDANKRQAEPWVFRGRHIGKALRPTFRTWARILEGAQISGLSFHDIRRSVRDRLTRDLEVPFPIAEGIIGHAPSRLTLTYNPSGVSLREMASALSRWASTLDAIVRNKKAEKVVRIAR